MWRDAWQSRRDLIAGVFVAVFTGALAVLLALWLVAAVIVGTAELLGMVR
jgi:hypothetical protein